MESKERQGKENDSKKDRRRRNGDGGSEQGRDRLMHSY